MSFSTEGHGPTTMSWSSDASTWSAGRDRGEYDGRAMADRCAPAPEPAAFRRALLRWYQRHERDLPWRRDADPYRVWVSEIMLQQTRIETVIPYYGRFLDRFPTVAALARADQHDVLKAWEGLGYYARARNLHRGARQLVETGAGRLPESAEQWREIPGVGEYTAAAIASITRDEVLPVADGNVRRVVARVLDEARLEPGPMIGFLRAAIDARRPGDFNQAIMELGQAVCTPRSPACPACPIRSHCRALAAGTVDRVPERKPKRAVPHLEIAIGVCRRGSRFLVSRRRPEAMLGGLWEFPGGKIERGETAQAALVREFREEVGIEVAAGSPLVVVPHRYTHLSVRLHAFHCRPKGNARARAIECAEVRWVTFEELHALAFPTANRKIITALEAGLRPGPGPSRGSRSRVR